MGSSADSTPVLVLGAGIAGLATAWHLTRSGIPTLVVDPAPRVFAHSSGANAAILRTVVDDPVTAQLAQRGALALREPPEDLARSSFVTTTGVVLTADDAESAAELERCAASCETATETITGEQLSELAPHVATEHVLALHAPGDGVVDLARLSAALVAAIERAGGTVRTGVGAVDWLGAGGEVSGAVLTDGSRVDARAVVVAAGGYAARLGRRAGSRIALAPRRRHAAKLVPDAAEGSSVDARWPVVWNAGDAFYSRPFEGGLLVCNCDESVVEPDACELDDERVAALRASTQRHLVSPYADGALEPWCALRTFAPDGRFVLGLDPDVEGLFWAAGFGGHGITCGLAAGEVVAHSVRGENDPLLAAHAPAREGARRTD